MIKSLSDCIVIVDDIHYITEIIRDSLADAGFTDINIFTNPITALESIKKGLKPEVVITDFNMPNLNGFELLEQLTRLIPDFDEIIVTSNPLDIHSVNNEYPVIGKVDGFADLVTSHLHKLMESHNSVQEVSII